MVDAAQIINFDCCSIDGVVYIFFFSLDPSCKAEGLCILHMLLSLDQVVENENKKINEWKNVRLQ